MRKRAAVAALGMAILLAACAARPPAEIGRQRVPPAGAHGTLPAVVARVVDGDTVEVALPDGGRAKVRLIGVNAPELPHEELGIREQPYGRQASVYTRRSLAGKQVFLEFDVQERDKYGRLLAYVWLSRPATGDEVEVRERMFNARLLLDGYAQVMTVPPNVKYAEAFRRLEAEARAAGRGLWGAAPRRVGRR